MKKVFSMVFAFAMVLSSLNVSASAQSEGWDCLRTAEDLIEMYIDN